MTLAPIERTEVLPVLSTALGETLEVWREAAELAAHISRTEFVPSALRGKPEAVTAAILRAGELGISPLHGLSAIHIIDGRPALSAELMRALVQSKGHDIWIEEWTTTRVILCGQRSGSAHVSKSTWTMDDAKRAKLEGKQNWARYPKAMLLARATGELCRLMFADVLAGLSYAVEEVEDGFYFETTGDEQAASDAPAPAKTTTRKAAAPRARARKATAAPANVVPLQPPPPPLPGEEGDAGDGTLPGTDVETDDVRIKRAQAIAMRARDAGVDHHHVVAAVTNGAKTSAKEVTAEEGSDVLQALVDLKEGERALVADGDGWVLIHPGDERWPAEASLEEQLEESLEAQGVEPPAADVDEGDPEAQWTGGEWRSFLSEHGVKVTEALREAQRLSKLVDDDRAPGTLDDLKGREGLCSVLYSWVLETGQSRGK